MFSNDEIQTIGHTSLTVSNLCYGTWQFGGDWGSFEVREAQGAIRHALEIATIMKDAVPTGGPSPEAM